MWRAFMILCTVVFGLGAIAGAVLIVVSLVERDAKGAATAALGTPVLGLIAFACRRDWQRENQRREFERGGPG
jgi:hypothetical protein